VRNAVFAAMLAKDGFTGPTAVFEGKAGLWDIVGRFEWTLPGEGEHRIGETHMKCFPICYHGQSAAWAAFELRRRVAADQVTRIEVETYRQAVGMMASDASRWAPKTRDTADHSLPYVISTALLDGEITSASFTPEMLQRRSVVELMSKVKVTEDPALSKRYPECAACRLKVHTGSAEPIVIEMLHPKGHVNAPMDDADIDNKFRGMFREYGSDGDGEKVLNALRAFDECADVGDVVRLIQRAAYEHGMRSVA
jgi:2-methylcitrate dehydratase